MPELPTFGRAAVVGRWKEPARASEGEPPLPLLRGNVKAIRRRTEPADDEFHYYNDRHLPLDLYLVVDDSLLVAVHT